jgi:hypothetical protein
VSYCRDGHAPGSDARKMVPVMSDEQGANPFEREETPLLREAFSLAWKRLSDTKTERARDEVAVDRLVGALMSVAVTGGLDAAEIARRAVERYNTGQF